MPTDINKFIELYESWGISYMPLFPRTKQPCLPAWKELTTERPTTDQVVAWKKTYWNPDFWVEVWNGEKEPALKKRWQKALEGDWKKAGVEGQLNSWSYDGSLSVAVIGSPTTGLCLVDIEDITLLSKKDQDAITGNDWETPVCKTGKPNGHHIYVRIPAEFAENTRGSNGEVRANGQYVVAAPSVHPNGATYTLIKRFPIRGIPKELAAEAMDLFKKMINATPNVVVESREEGGFSEKLQKLFAEDRGFYSAYNTPTPIGERSEVEFYLIVTMWEKGFTEDEIYKAMTASPQTKWRERNDSYRETTVRNAIAKAEATRKKLEETRAMRGEILKGLPDRLNDDPGVVY